jgi:hypothetical protein
VVEFGFLTGDFLNNLSTILKEVYAPLLDQQMGGSSVVNAAMASHDATSNNNSNSTSNGAATATREVVKSGDTSRNEFRSNLQKVGQLRSITSYIALMCALHAWPE